jgi:hypothetical protein
MGANMRLINKSTTFTYGKAVITYHAGMMIDVPTGSALETAIGTSNLTALSAAQIASPATTRPEIDIVHMGGGNG